MPLAGGTPVPESRVGTLPGDLFRLGTDGTMTVRDFDGATAGFTSPIALNGLTSTSSPSAASPACSSGTARLYYILSGDARLYFRWFTPRAAPSAPTPSSPAAPPTAATGPPSPA
jgi:hypothetical protein